MYEGFFIVWDM
ncbi:hypothetical protein LV89_03233 [Arcicella aurantiaca]|uniref:Uncharacterized protein n=1 Tax=Arcicella aurantiaca TaxID=591202 RepID=A0A316DX53_9BACT|nr:hypothetical protein LV89_03233 [Arcicella aurantiaca]